MIKVSQTTQKFEIINKEAFLKGGVGHISVEVHMKSNVTSLMFVFDFTHKYLCFLVIEHLIKIFINTCIKCFLYSLLNGALNVRLQF
ncbi:MAG: hypothetical protein BAJALOKI3v1_780001 [Promethearchaeota archaeon]|nr:MAG: hypothetical protein BAJALOKI3v1_780001 [Candidatus Lokiarchaeota archaeon]